MSAQPKEATPQTHQTEVESMEALLWVPAGYKDYTKFKPSVRAALANGCPKGLFQVKILSKKFENQGRVRIAVKAQDARGEHVDMAIFDSGSFDLWKMIPPGRAVFVEGTPETWNDRLQLKNASLVPKHLHGRIVPVYRGRKGLTAQVIADTIEALLPAKLNEVLNHIQSTIRESEKRILTGAKAKAPSLARMLLDMHAPVTIEAGMEALNDARRIAVYQIVRTGAQAGHRQANQRSRISIDREHLNVLAATLPFKLTRDQIGSIKEIIADLDSDIPMRRILTGDVGTGKTATFALAAAAARNRGAKVAVLVPNQLLVDQIAGDIAGWWPDIPVRKIKSGERLGDLSDNPVLVGTTALIFQVARQGQWKADLVIADEQHKQSTKIREALLQEHSNLLEATATPIPRTSALIAYGGMDISVLRECPVKKTIRTHVVDTEQRASVFNHIKEIVLSGSQVAVIYPKVSDEEKAKSSVEQAAAQWEKILPGRIGVLHGRMSDAEKEEVITGMKSRKFDVLISSTVIEVGVTLPDLKALMVVNPDRYGVAQLHQMRGRVARKGGEGFFFLYCQEDISPETSTRLDLLVQHADGFTLAEKDAEMRGFGDLSSDSDAQAGVTKTVFNAIKLMPVDFVEVAGK